MVSLTGEMSVLTRLERHWFSRRYGALSALCDVVEIETGSYAHRDTLERRWARLYREFESPPLRHSRKLTKQFKNLLLCKGFALPKWYT